MRIGQFTPEHVTFTPLNGRYVAYEFGTRQSTELTKLLGKVMAESEFVETVRAMRAMQREGHPSADEYGRKVDNMLASIQKIKLSK